MPQKLPRIHVLTPDVIGKIAAGEVIERPASLVKELVENSLDAGATHVDVAIEAGGKRLIRIADDGCGIEPDDLPLAVTRHATSKLKTEEDLFRIATLGFRGEALGAAAAVSKLEIQSRPKKRTEGHTLSVRGGEIGEVAPCGLAPGTVVEVRDLFWNVPPRLAFLKTDQHEGRLCAQEVTRIALARPDVAFSLHHGDREVLDTGRGTPDLRDRIAALHGRALSKTLTSIEAGPRREGGPSVSGFVAPFTETRSSGSHQFFFVNGRAVRDRVMVRALRDAFRGLIAAGRHPIGYVFVELDPAEVDVNVHPTKAEVKFKRSQEIVSLVIAAVRDALDATNAPGAWAVGVDRGGNAPAARGPEGVLGRGDVAGGGGGGALGGWVPPGDGRAVAAATATPPAAIAGGVMATAADALAPGLPFGDDAIEAGGGRGGAIQIHDRYIVEEVADGVHLIDQHALHEWILYTEILDRMNAAPVEVQKLLFPAVVEVGGAEMEAFRDARDAFAELGIEVEEFGESSLAVRAVPRIAGKADAEDLCRSILADLIEGRPHAEAKASLLERVAASVACKAAVKFGMKLQPDEIDALLARRGSVVRGFCCPHGRPTTIFLAREELDRRFGR